MTCAACGREPRRREILCGMQVWAPLARSERRFALVAEACPLRDRMAVGADPGQALAAADADAPDAAAIRATARA